MTIISRIIAAGRGSAWWQVSNGTLLPGIAYGPHAFTAEGGVLRAAPSHGASFIPRIAGELGGEQWFPSAPAGYAYDKAGISSAGDTAVIGQFKTSFPDFGSGSVQIFNNVDGTWIPAAAFAPPNPPETILSVSISASGSTVAVTSSNAGTGETVLSLYERIDSVWQLTNQFAASGIGPNTSITAAVCGDGFVVALLFITGGPDGPEFAMQRFSRHGGTWMVFDRTWQGPASAAGGLVCSAYGSASALCINTVNGPKIAIANDAHPTATELALTAGVQHQFDDPMWGACAFMSPDGAFTGVDVYDWDPVLETYDYAALHLYADTGHAYALAGPVRLPSGIGNQNYFLAGGSLLSGRVLTFIENDGANNFAHWIQRT